jgi:hypothetical protein
MIRKNKITNNGRSALVDSTERRPYDAGDVKLDDEISAAEAKLVALYAKRANKYVVSDWYWCACGREKVLRAGAYANYTRCSHPQCTGTGRQGSV